MQKVVMFAYRLWGNVERLDVLYEQRGIFAHVTTPRGYQDMRKNSDASDCAMTNFGVQFHFAFKLPSCSSCVSGDMVWRPPLISQPSYWRVSVRAPSLHKTKV